jgi:hypothetical protein
MRDLVAVVVAAQAAAAADAYHEQLEGKHNPDSLQFPKGEVVLLKVFFLVIAHSLPALVLAEEGICQKQTDSIHQNEDS